MLESIGAASVRNLSQLRAVVMSRDHQAHPTRVLVRFNEADLRRIDIAGFRLVVDTADVSVSGPMLAKGVWEPHLSRVFHRCIKKGMRVADIGANVGAYTVLLAQWVGQSGRVYAFEPSGAAFRGLVRHIALNLQDDVARPLAVAVSSREGSGNLIVAATAGESRLAGAGDEAVVVNVPVTTIDAFCRQEGVQPSFIKIDVEGEELAVLRGARETIARGGDRLALFVELHPSIWALNGTARAAFELELERQCLRIEPLGDRDPWSVEGMVVRLVRR